MPIEQDVHAFAIGTIKFLIPDLSLFQAQCAKTPGMPSTVEGQHCQYCNAMSATCNSVLYKLLHGDIQD